MNYKHVLIVTYGRSGSTLLQGILNSIDGCVVRGENFDACRGLFQMFLALQYTKAKLKTDKSSESSENPWYGSKLIDEERFLIDARTLLINQLMPPKAEESYQCIGFKEIRYFSTIEEDQNRFSTELHAYLNFLIRLLPQCALIFLTRNPEQVARSAWWKNASPEPLKKNLTIFKAALIAYAAGKPETFMIDYTDMTQQTHRLREMFEFLGAPYIKEDIESVLNLKHSY